MANNFTWVATHKQLTQYLSTKEHQQDELISLLKSVGIGPFKDKTTDGDHDSELTEIDPFTFFCYIYKYGPKKCLSYLQNIANKTNVQIPSDVDGVPTAQPQQVWLFPYKFIRTNNEVGRLWSFFQKAISKSVKDPDFEDVLQINSVGKPKITEALFYVDPERYLPINGPTKAYIKEVIGINPNFESLTDYLKLLEEIKSKVDVPLYEISYKAWEWKKKNKSINYWVFQANPKIFDFETALKNDLIKSWTVTAHKDNISIEDKVIIWITGPKAGCYALAEVKSAPHDKTASPDDHLWKEAPKSELQADISITYNLLHNPITKEEISPIKELLGLKVGNQGTNFTATENEYEILLKMAQQRTNQSYWLYAPGEQAYLWDEFFELGIMGIGWDAIGDLRQYKNQKEIKDALIQAYVGRGSKKNDLTANYDFLHNMKIGDVVIAKKGRKELLGFGVVESDYIYDETRSEFKNIRKVSWKKRGNWKVNFSLALKTLTDITKYKSGQPEYNTYYERLLGIMNSGVLVTPESVNHPLNTIFYGPPGTGKTYKTILRAAEIAENRSITNYDDAVEIFNAKLGDQIEFITFHQNYSYEDFIQGLRPDTDNENGLLFEKRDGIFKKIADRALKNLLDSEKPTVKKKPFDEVFNDYIRPHVEGEVKEIEVKMKTVSFYITGITNRSIEFRKESGGTSHTLSIQTLRRMYDAGSVMDIQGLASYYTPLLGKLLENGIDSAGKKEVVTRRKYVIVIDEINRANISRVFGELITLIEKDKRSHGEIPMKVTLPSGDKFIVPSNLYIIGTMNTADKSIALLDIALRRRFEFEPMYPQYDIPGIFDVDILKKINEKIIDTKRRRDFQIGHSYFMGENKDLLKRMNNKVIPLLLEYYMNDEEEVKTILRSAGLVIDEDAWPIRITGRK
jgi:5-methylcytosine-specific restriction protein B